MSKALKMVDFPLILNGVNRPLFCKDGSGRFVSANRQALTYLCIEDGIDWLIGKREEELALRSSFIEFHQQSLECDETTWLEGQPCAFLLDIPDIEDKRVDYSGEIVTRTPYHNSGHKVEVLKFPLFDINGNRQHLLTLIFDLTSDSFNDGTMKNLSNHLDLSYEAERKSVARDVHDVIGNSITAIRMSLNMIKHYIQGNNSAAALADLDTALNVCDEAAYEVRRISTGLRPGVLDEYGVAEAIEWLINDYDNKYKDIDFIFDLSVLPDVTEKIPEGVSIAMFRIAQEAISNAIKHAKCSEIILSLSLIEGELHMTICDNGIGFKFQNTGGLGLVSMRERARTAGGHLLITNSNGMVITFGINVDSMVDIFDRKNTP